MLTVDQWYKHAHAKDMPLRAIARLIQTMLYAQRFFPYYVYNILGGIEEDGKSPSQSQSGSGSPRVRPRFGGRWSRRLARVLCLVSKRGG